MAKDVITRFKLETTAFDSKLRDTAKGLQNIAHQAELGGKDFNNFSQKAIEAARALGTVQSGATNTKDKLRDLVGSYNDAAKAYNSLSDAAKQGEFGKAMAASLQKLQQDIKDTKEELYGLGDAVKNMGGGLFGEGGITGMLQVAGGNLLSKGFEKIVGGITETWQKSIELARAGEGVRIAFERLNKPGLLDNLKEATHGTVSEVELMKQAIKFENFKLPLEDLATYLAFAQQKAKDTGESVDYMVNSITTGLGRQSKQILDNLGISAAELTKRMNEGADMTKAVADIIREEMAKAGDYVETAADKAAQAAAKATDELEKFGRQAAPIAEEWGQTWNAISIAAMDFANTLLGPVAESIRTLQNIWNNGWEDSLTNSPFNIEGKGKPKFGYQGMGSLQSVTAPGGYVEVTDKNTGAVIGGQHFDNLSDTNSIKAWQKTLFKTPKGGGGSKKNLPEYSDFSKLLFKNGSQDLKAEIPFNSVYNQLKPENILGTTDEWENYKDTITGSIGSIGEAMSNLTNWTVDFDPYKEKMDELSKSAKQQQMAMGLAANAVNAFSSALAGMEDPGAKAAGIVMQSLASIALGFATASAQANTAGTGWGWLAWVAAGLAAMATAISTVHQLTGFAQGGIVKGNSYSGDNINAGEAMVNAGELVLTRAQQNSLASQLSDNSRGGVMTAVVRGEQLYLTLNRYGMRTGKGEVLTSR